MPRPTRIRPLRAPALSLISLSFIVCTRFRFCRAGMRRRGLALHLHHMLYLADHAANLGRVRQFAGLVHLVEAKTNQRCTLAGFAPDRRSGLRDLDRRHLSYSTTAAASASATSTETPLRRSR